METSPTRPSSSKRFFTPSQGTPYVEIPTYKRGSSSSAPPRKLPTPNVAPAPPKKSRKAGDVLDALLKEKKAHTVKKFLAPIEEMEVDNPLLSSPAKTAVGETPASPDAETFLATAEKLVVRMDRDALEDERNEQRKRMRTKMMKERSVFWLNGGEGGDVVEPAFPDVKMESKGLEILGKAYRSRGAARLIIANTTC